LENGEIFGREGDDETGRKRKYKKLANRMRLKGESIRLSRLRPKGREVIEGEEGKESQLLPNLVEEKKKQKKKKKKKKKKEKKKKKKGEGHERGKNSQDSHWLGSGTAAK